MKRIGLVSMSSILSSRKDFLKGAFCLAALSAAGCAFGFAPSLACPSATCAVFAPDAAAHGALCAQTAGQFPVSENVRGHENTEWSQSYAYHLTDAKKDLPRVLLVGDSVCRAYADGVGRILDGKMNVTFWVSSYCVTSPNYMRLLSVMLDEAKYDVVHFNNTLHSLQTKTADWERAFESALSLVRKKQPEAKIVWCTGTPLRNAAKTRKSAELNEAGARVVAKLGGIVTNDLFRLLDPLDRKRAWRDDYHFTAAASSDIARRVAERVGTDPTERAFYRYNGNNSFSSHTRLADRDCSLTTESVR